jgi:hypothetical protein
MADRTKDLMRYDVKRFPLIPLHRPKATRTDPNGKVRQMGKAPLHAQWTTKKYDSAKVRADAIEQKRNVGVRLTDEILVIDVDPRNGGEEGFASLCHDIGIDGDAYPRVITGSGGWHCYMSKPAEVLVRDTLDNEEYNGVEFKSRGRQVVAAGSLHPNGKPYYWSPDHPAIEDDLPACPTSLLNVIKRPPRSAVTGGGQYTPAQMAEVLSRLNVNDFDSNDKWFPLMQACHHATAGEARTEFIEWSVGGDGFEKDAYGIGKRWDSLHADRNDGVTYRTLNKILRDNGAADAQVATVEDDEFPDDLDTTTGAADDFDGMEDKPKPTKRNKVKPEYAMFDGADDDDDDGVRPENLHGWPDESVGVLENLNKTYVALLEGGKFKIMYPQEDHEQKGRKAWETCDRGAFESMYANQMIERDMTGLSRNAASAIPVGEAWIKWPGRRTVKGVVFEPETGRGERDGWLNLWNGFAIEPDTTRKGSYKWMRELLFEVISDGKQDVFDYIWNWTALMFQQPATVPGTALVFRGGQGVGKGTFGNMLVRMIGQHAHAIADSEQLTGRFNAHMRNLIFLFADEATGAYNKAAEAKLRHMITEPNIQIEKKGIDLMRVRNLLHVMMASNEKWVVPAGSDERRYFCQEVNTKWQRSDKFDKLHDEINANGAAGLRALMADLLTHKIPKDWKPRHFPLTKALVDQKILSMTPMKRFWYNRLMDQALDFVVMGDWRDKPIAFFLTDMRDAFNQFCRNNDIKPGSGGRSSHSQLMAEVKELFPSAEMNLRMTIPADRDDMDAGLDRAALAMRVPPINQCFREFERTCGLPDGQLGHCIGFD